MEFLRSQVKDIEAVFLRGLCCCDKMVWLLHVLVDAWFPFKITHLSWQSIDIKLQDDGFGLTTSSGIFSYMAST